MPLKPLAISRLSPHSQAGASLIEVLVAILVLSFGMLALGVMLSFAIQMPKLSGYRSTAVNLASSHIERIRANPAGSQSYDDSSTNPTHTGWAFTQITPVNCYYPDCSASTLATMDDTVTRQAVRSQLPGGDMFLTYDTSGAQAHGGLWIVWQEPSSYAAFNPTTSDNCPPNISAAYIKPRCIYLGFTL